MAVVVLGIDALDPELVDTGTYPNLTLERYEAIDTILSSSGEPSTHELWPTIITGLKPAEHGLELDDGVTWENPLLRTASSVGDVVLPDGVQTKLGAWLLNSTSEDAFRAPATYYEENELSTVFDDVDSKAIGIPNYVVNADSEDREHQLRRDVGKLFERDPNAKGGHVSADPDAFYEQCLEMAMVRIARVRRGLRGRRFELVFGYTSGLDLIGHVSHDRNELQDKAYEELDEFVGELRYDLREKDELILVSDHGLQDGLHTEEAVIAATEPSILNRVKSVLGVRDAIESLLAAGDHSAGGKRVQDGDVHSMAVRKQLEDLGYM